ncbi:tRNA (adenosine(37)-N6)-threonylcarbamoyltransferase complex ATPase subunit type 1 TsaE [Thermoflavimicrobium daqui]|jgi:tRNA threonylcarbamoyladenosine biosynthesis protein TsaE|uniref:tRNA threonylcarbamoyladenosine biosynthesis protein TsaE n=1 Tax=Thermoflavimicrobium daqui TaxID=2137476 RepID=A0A364K276_9BACL|nr:tRNA (adenosine(37)-N6)-threonylcarbamoyltransferase complex ATPase subunit type 1 TsaE [Thermoflavimicrobium daqui]RAL22033.1 tRNA (adenosine(37)-N6)-threonylcarbamoyltransferase complex ATPase subunit type 1 TsaE [Thermoflavimicrobium daqui]
MTCQFFTRSEAETKDLARRLAKQLKPGDVLALEGDLGAGKTTFAKGLAEGLGITRHVDSPTFTIIKEYLGVYPFYHMDVYRLETAEAELGLDEYFYGEGICLVEWASRIASILPEETIYLSITVQPDDSRKIEIRSTHIRAKQLCKGGL